jgi:hypothetical protein
MLQLGMATRTSSGILPLREFSAARGVACGASAPSTITITKPDDWHLHLRDGDGLASVVPHSALHFQRCSFLLFP